MTFQKSNYEVGQVSIINDHNSDLISISSFAFWLIILSPSAYSYQAKIWIFNDGKPFEIPFNFAHGFKICKSIIRMELSNKNIT